jgi:hypothetical protein
VPKAAQFFHHDHYREVRTQLGEGRDHGGGVALVEKIVAPYQVQEQRLDGVTDCAERLHVDVTAMLVIVPNATSIEVSVFVDECSYP